MKLEYVVRNNLYKNVMAVLRGHFGISKNLIIRLKSDNKIMINAKPTYTSKELLEGDVVSVAIDFEENNSNIVPTEMPLDIIYEDECYIVINKLAGIPVHPSALHYSDTLSNGVRFYFDSIGLKKKIRPINRLDRNTSGIVIFAKNEYVQERLVKQMEKKIFKKEYVAIVDGVLEDAYGTIDAPIARKEGSIIERCIHPAGDASITHFEVIKHIDNLTVVKILLETGRTHQIRVHMAHMGYPVLGDSLYGSESSLMNRQALHAYKVQFVHPVSNASVEYVAEVPEDMKNLILHTLGINFI